MEQGLESFNSKTDKIFNQLYEKIFSYLDFSSLIQDLTVSKDFYGHLNKYFKQFLFNNQLIAAPEDANEDEEEDYYLKLFCGFYAREVLACQLSSIKQTYNELNLARFPSTNQGIKDFAIGAKFTAFHLHNNDLIFVKNEEYLDPSFDMKNINSNNIRKNVAKFNAKSNDLFYLTNAGHLRVIFFDANIPSHELTEATLNLSLTKPIADMNVTYPHAVLLFKSSNSNHSHEEEEEKVHQDIRCFDMQNMTPEDFNSPLRLKKVEGLDDKKIISFCVGIHAAYFLSNQNKVFECNFEVINNDKYMIFSFDGLKNKIIKRLWAGPNYFFAMEQKEIPSIDQWSPEEVIEWAESKVYSEFTNILKYENITGKDLLNADKEFLLERIGMETEDMQVKFMNDIQKLSKITYGKPKLYGWGNNNYGQLGINTGHTIVHQPIEIKTLPEFDKDDNIKDIECGFKATVIVTEQGKVWITEVLPKKGAVVAPTVAKEEEEEVPTNKKSNQNKKKKPEAQAKKQEAEKTPSTHTNTAAVWLNITPKCEELRDGRQYQIVKVSLSKDYLIVLGSYLGTNTKENLSITKFKGADHICDRLLWDKKLNRDEFVVGYEDRFLGILEIPFNEFCTKKDIPTHRIKFFKRKEEIVWDRTLKINKI